ncbi:hypothetical protein [Aliamphritea hakodatensis]|uniref:hypothetical protein n=1 Tax=Aliamphritea hakodatensis TaxID=2895352 RepID=UPI0022FDAFE6|nr:hypothetical protein [Aliamphritea hakodatensis]
MFIKRNLCLFTIQLAMTFISPLSSADQSDKKIGSLLYQYQEYKLAADTLKNSTNKFDQQRYISLLLSGRLGEVKIKEARAFFEKSDLKNQYSSNYFNALITYFETKNTSLLDNLPKAISLTRIGTFLVAKHHINNLRYDDAYKELQNKNDWTIWEIDFLKAQLILEKKVQDKYHHSDSGITYLVSAYIINSGHQFDIPSDAPTLFLMEILQDGKTMPKDNITAMAIALASPAKSQKVINRFNKILLDSTLSDVVESKAVAMDIINQRKNYFTKYENFLQPYLLDKIYRIQEGQKKGLPISYDAYDTNKIIHQ